MGYFSELDIEINEIDAIEATEERALDFDEKNYLDGAWWAEQDAEMRQEEIEHVEAQAEIQEMVHNGYGM
jgi:hypothetical protein